MANWQTEPRETYLIYLAVRNELATLAQYPDPLHEGLKAEYSGLLELATEALEQDRSTTPREAKNRAKKVSE